MAVDANVPSRKFRPTGGPSIGRIKSLLAGPHGPNSRIFEALAQNTPDCEYWFEDFNQSAITATTGPFTTGNAHTLAYAESNAGATDPAKLAPTELDSSSLQLATSANAYAQTIVGPAMYSANKFPFFEVRFKVSQITDFSVVIGFANAIAASAGDIVSDIDTPAVGTVADGAFYAIDIAQTLKTAALVTVGTTTAVAKTVVSPVTAPFGIPTVSVFTIVRIELDGDPSGATTKPSVARLYINDYLAATMPGPDSEKLLLPVFFQKSPAGTALTTQIDYMRAGQFKALAPF